MKRREFSLAASAAAAGALTPAAGAVVQEGIDLLSLVWALRAADRQPGARLPPPRQIHADAAGGRRQPADPPGHVRQSAPGAGRLAGGKTRPCRPAAD